MYTFCIIMIAIASVLLILAVLVQAPKSGMAANFGAANQTMGVRQTSDFLEKFTWAMVAAIVLFTLLSVTAMPEREAAQETEGYNPIEASKDQPTTSINLEVPAEGAAAETTVTVPTEGEAKSETPAEDAAKSETPAEDAAKSEPAK
ncbi:MAG: preprotein translocase subunit SecG [Alistipes sp.]|nr:preprotein translocase subunit SecG [Alistipes sp.]